MRNAWSLAIIPVILFLIAADQPVPAPSAPPSGVATPSVPQPVPATAAPSTPAAPATPPGTVTSVVDPGLLTHGKNVLHGITRDPKTGDLVIGVSNKIAHVIPMVTTTFSNDDSLRKVTPAGAVSRLTGFPYPNAMLFNPHDGMLYVAVGAVGCNEQQGGMTVSRHCPGTNGIIVVDPATGDHHDFVGAGPGFADGKGTDARFTAAGGIAFDPATGNMFIADTENQRVRQVTLDGTVTTIAGSGTRGNADGNGATASFAYPRGIAYCANDKTLVIADTNNNEIRKVTLDGKVTTIAGTTDTGYADGPAASARFDHPRGIACDEAGIVYVADTDNNAIRAITTAGAVITLAGAKQMGTVNAVGSAARFSNPTDLWYEPSDHSLYVIDFGDNNVRKVTAAPPQ
ncbi:MAG TPA: hypothetical protein VFF60_05215 [Candidatus Binatus sp.]|nr:hypothetical protein [Candidatus Binatus sp.]